MIVWGLSVPFPSESHAAHMEGNESGMCAALEKWRAQLLAARIAAASVCVGEAACVCMREAKTGQKGGCVGCWAGSENEESPRRDR